MAVGPEVAVAAVQDRVPAQEVGLDRARDQVQGQGLHLPAGQAQALALVQALVLAQAGVHLLVQVEVVIHPVGIVKSVKSLALSSVLF